MSGIKDEVFLGINEDYNALLQRLAELAQPEKWSYGKFKNTDPYKILRNYFEHTYDRIREEEKFIYSTDQTYKCMNTGLLTSYNQELYAVFAKNQRSSGLPWCFTRICKDTDKFFSLNFSKKPDLADYVENNVENLFYDKRLEIRLNINHIIDDNFERFANVGFSNREIINAFLVSAKETLIKKLLRNFKLAVPFYYHNTDNDEHKIQLLVPVYFPGTPVRLAFVLDKQNDNSGKYYEAITVLPVEWAYMNSRLIVKPDEEWAKLIDDIDSPIGNSEFTAQITSSPDSETYNL